METIHTERLQLRKLTPETYPDVFSRMNDEELMEFFGCRNADDLEEERTKLREGLSMYRKSLLLFQLIERESGKNIGWCGYHTWYVRHDRAEIGYVLTDESRRKKGYMKEALREVIRYGFEVMNLHRIEAMTGRDNEASTKLLLSHGFELEGVLKEHYLVEGVYEDSLMYGLIRPAKAGY